MSTTLHPPTADYHPDVNLTNVMEALYTLNSLRGVPYKADEQAHPSPRYNHEYYIERRVDPRTNKIAYQLFEFTSNRIPVPVLATGWTSLNDLFRHICTYTQAFLDGERTKKSKIGDTITRPVQPLVIVSPAYSASVSSTTATSGVYYTTNITGSPYGNF